MASGLEIRDENGNLIVGSSTSLGKVIGTIIIRANPDGSGAENQEGMVYNDLFGRGTPFFFLISSGSSAWEIDTAYTDPVVSFGSNYIRWTRGSSPNGHNYYSGCLFWGIY